MIFGKRVKISIWSIFT